jgi:hypothetical protein
MRRAQHIFRASLQIRDALNPDEDAIRAFEDADLHDILFGGPNSAGVFEVDFRRRAPRFEDAVLNVFDDLRRAFPEARVLEVKPANLATHAEISERMGHSHKFLRLLIKGRRGPGRFPRPADNRRGRRTRWCWNEVERWFREEMGIAVPEHNHRAFLATVNALLRLQRVVPQVPDARPLAALLPPELTNASGRQPVEDQVGAR